jgi:hypothetical protein
MMKKIVLTIIVFLIGFSVSFFGFYLGGLDIEIRNFSLGYAYFISILIGLQAYKIFIFHFNYEGK